VKIPLGPPTQARSHLARGLRDCGIKKNHFKIVFLHNPLEAHSH
jgi:hypothetical protein